MYKTYLQHEMLVLMWGGKLESSVIRTSNGLQ